MKNLEEKFKAAEKRIAELNLLIKQWRLQQVKSNEN